jgi:hypothetical protein
METILVQLAQARSRWEKVLVESDTGLIQSAEDLGESAEDESR